MKRWRGVALAAAVALGAVELVPGAGAAGQTEADQRRIQEEIKDLRGQVQEASAEEARLLGEIDAANARKRELDSKVASLDGRIGQVEAELAAAEAALASLDAQQRAEELRLAQAHAEYEQARAELRQQAIAAYTGQPDAAFYLEITLQSGDIGELAAKQAYLRAVHTTQQQVVAKQERARDVVSDARQQLEQARKLAEEQHNVVAARRGVVQGERDSQAALRRQVEGEIAAESRVRSEVVARKREFQAQVAELQRESEAIAASLRRRAASGTANTQPAPGRLQNPLPGYPISSPFGNRTHPIFGDVRMHTGIDISAGTGAPILAAAGGVVVSAESLGGYGNATVIDHGGSLATLYGHQSGLLVTPGQVVSAGQTIGRVGCSGSCTGPHLHFEVRRNGSPVNPSSYL